jgi:PAS domain S-box-containing protein
VPARIERSFYRIMQSLMEGVVIEDSTGHIVLANRALEQLLGYRPGELVGLHWTALVPGTVHERVKILRNSTLARNASRYESQMLCHDGSLVWVSVHRRPLYDAGQSGGAFLIISPLSQHEQTLAEERAASQTALEWAEAQLSRTEESITLGRHLSSVVHDLNNPLTIILLQAQLLRKAAAHTPQVWSGLAIIQDQAQRMRRMVQDLLAFAGPPSAQFETIDVNALLSWTLEQQRLVQLEDIQLITNLASDLPVMEGDPDRLQQVFVNIVNNAQQAIHSHNGLAGSSPERRGKVRVTTALVHSNRDHEARIGIRFDDDGPGIPPEAMPYIFEPFFTTKKSGEGTGLGLSICERIVREHGGRIWAENNEEGGASFIIELPLRAPVEQDRPGQTRSSVQHVSPAEPHLFGPDLRLERAQASETHRQLSGYRTPTTS